MAVDTIDLLSEEDEKLLKFLQTVKQNISYIIGIDNIIDEIRNIINESSHFTFRSKRNERLISKAKPLFVLSVDLGKISKEYQYKFGKDENKDCSLIQNLIQQEVTSVFSKYLSDTLRDKDVMNRLLEDNNVRHLNEEDLMLLNFITSAVFSVMVEMKTNTVYLEYIK